MDAHDELRAFAEANPAVFDRYATDMGWVPQSEVEEATKAQLEDARWLLSREMWGDDPSQPRRYPNLPLDHASNDPRKRPK
jgi:hypothetical protein